MQLEDRRHELWYLYGHSKPKKYKDITGKCLYFPKEKCLHYLAKSYKLIIGKSKKTELIDKIINYEINNGIIDTISNPN
tara:strand:- start:193 stop:429 length:237 start_codon:yes stop_codon:yes gene_type:complete